MNEIQYIRTNSRPFRPNQITHISLWLQSIVCCVFIHNTCIHYTVVQEVNFIDLSILQRASDMPPFVTPEKSHSDNREYRIFTLDNGLQILVISDSTTDKVTIFHCILIKHPTNNHSLTLLTLPGRCSHWSWCRISF